MFKKESQSEIKLILAGQIFWGFSDINLAIKDNHLENEVILTGRLNDDEISDVLGSAIALTYVPYYEGFGIPLIEAMEVQIPIITSNVTSLPEIAGDAAILVNPLEIQEIKNAMMKIYNNESICKDLITKGILQKQKFSWDKSANLLWDSILLSINSAK